MATTEALAAAVGRVVDEAVVAAFRRAMPATAGLVLAGALAAALLIEGRRQAEGKGQTEARAEDARALGPPPPRGAVGGAPVSHRQAAVGKRAR